MATMAMKQVWMFAHEVVVTPEKSTVAFAMEVNRAEAALAMAMAMAEHELAVPVLWYSMRIVH
jgi:hypothetical protein